MASPVQASLSRRGSLGADLEKPGRGAVRFGYRHASVVDTLTQTHWRKVPYIHAFRARLTEHDAGAVLNWCHVRASVWFLPVRIGDYFVMGRLVVVPGRPAADGVKQQAKLAHHVPAVGLADVWLQIRRATLASHGGPRSCLECSGDVCEMGRSEGSSTCHHFCSIPHCS